MPEVIKGPEFEGDSFLIRLKDFRVGSVEGLPDTDVSYYRTKLKMFEEEDVFGTDLDRFALDRPSLRSLSDWRASGFMLDSTNYAVAATRQNGVSVKNLLADYSNRLANEPTCRRCVLRLANPGAQYLASTIEHLDVSCTLAMHFLSDRTSIVMRASDVLNELVPDLLLARDFFVRRVFPGAERVDVEVYASTAQNIDAWDDTMSKLAGLSDGARREER